MCAINPKHQHHYKLSVYTSHDMSEEDFATLVIGKVVELEMKLNEDMRLRWHVEDITE